MSASRRALLVIDVQNEYVGGALPIAYPDMHEGLANIARAIDAARAAGVAVVVVQHTSPEGSAIFAKESPGWELHDAVRTRGYDHRFEKTFPSAFAGTYLGAWLTQQGIDTLTVVGYMTQNCIDSTIRQAMHEGFRVEFLRDAAGTVPYENAAGAASAEEIHRIFCVVLQSRFAAVASTDQWIGALESGLPLPRDAIHSSNLRARERLSQPKGDTFVVPGVRFRPLATTDAAQIARWPAYPAEFADLDYALRANGWLEEFRDKPGAHCFVAEESGEPIAFTILASSAGAEAEFRIALRADRIGTGLGRALARKTLALAFGELRVSRVHLVVRKNNPRAIRLYEGLGFVTRGERCETYNGKPAQFLVMDLHRDRESACAGA